MIKIKIQRLYKQVIQFGLAGVLTTLVDFTILYVLTSQLNSHYLVSSAIAFIVATVVNYWLSMTYIFSSKYKNKGEEFVVFLTLSILGLLLTQLLFWIQVDQLHMGVYRSKVVLTVVVMGFNFITRKLLMDSSNREESTEC